MWCVIFFRCARLGSIPLHDIACICVYCIHLAIVGLHAAPHRDKQAKEAYTHHAPIRIKDLAKCCRFYAENPKNQQNYIVYIHVGHNAQFLLPIFSSFLVLEISKDAIFQWERNEYKQWWPSDTIAIGCEQSAKCWIAFGARSNSSLRRVLSYHLPVAE